jgi:hypothetical protein
VYSLTEAMPVSSPEVKFARLHHNEPPPLHFGLFSNVRRDRMQNSLHLHKLEDYVLIMLKERSIWSNGETLANTHRGT